MANYLTDEQKAEFMRDLESESQGGVPDGDALTPEMQQQAIEEGASMAAADAANGAMQGGDPAQGQAMQEAPQEAENGAMKQLGFTSVDELANAYREALRSASEMRDMLTQLTAMRQAQENAEKLDPNDPEWQVKKLIRSELKPVYDRLRADARNRVVQEASAGSWSGKGTRGATIRP